MSVTRIVVLANSWKHGDWCIAGIDLDTGRWVRPVTDLDDGRIPKSAMKLRWGYFPRLLDVLEIPLDSTGPNYGFESENRSILPGRWKRRERLAPGDLLEHASTPSIVLHNVNRSVTPRELRGKPFESRTTLQLIRVEKLTVSDSRRERSERVKWTGSITTGGRQIEVGITDPVYVAKLRRGYRSRGPCLLTMSLGMPYKPPEWQEAREAECWKLIAGVIELPAPRSTRRMMYWFAKMVASVLPTRLTRAQGSRSSTTTPPQP